MIKAKICKDTSQNMTEGQDLIANTHTYVKELLLYDDIQKLVSILTTYFKKMIKFFLIYIGAKQRALGLTVNQC